MPALSRTRNTWLASSLALVVAGCQPAATLPSQAIGSASAPPAPQSPASEESPLPPTPSLPALTLTADVVDLVEPCPFEFDTCELKAGSYTSSRFRPGLLIALDDGWALRFHAPDVLDFQLPGARGNLTFQRGPRLAGDQPPLRDIEAVEARLREFAALDLGDPHATTLWGLPAVRLDVTANADVENAFVTGMRSTEHDQVVWLLARGSTTRFVTTIVDGEVVMVSYGTFASATFDDVVPLIERVLEVSRLAPS